MSTAFISLLLLIPLTLLFLGFSYIIYSLYEQIAGRPPFINTRKYAHQKITELLAPKEGAVVYDIGCGDGSVLKNIISTTKSTRGVGIEIHPLAVLLAKIKTGQLPIHIIQNDMFNIPLRDATHIYCYLLPAFAQKIEQKIISECKSGTRIVTCDFHFTTLVPKEVITLKEHALLSKTLAVYEL